jgi:hypothetical protein
MPRASRIAVQLLVSICENGVGSAGFVRPLYVAIAVALALLCPSIATASSGSFGATADSYVSASQPTSNYGSSTRLYVGGSPTFNTYVRFNVQLPAGTKIIGATVSLYTGSGSTTVGYQAYAVADTSWGEYAITYQNAPPFGAFLGESGGWSTSGYKAVVLPAGYVHAGLNSIGIATTATSAKRFWSREAGSNPPQLEVSYTTNPTRHFAAETDSDQSLALSMGYDLMDVSGSHFDPSATKAAVDALPSGVQALIWVGNLDNTNCTTPGYTTAQFQALVDAMASDPKVYGYYIADEPHPLVCSNAATDIRTRADYLHAHSSSQKAFIVVQDGWGPCGSNLGCEFSALQPADTHVDLIGLDPYPCHYSSLGVAVPCNYNLITQRVAAATANGIPQSTIVPVFQTFGQEHRTDGRSVYYRTPTTSELSTILSTWDSLVPNPAMDYAYTFGVQCSTTCLAPQALVNHPELRPIMQAHNGW